MLFLDLTLSSPAENLALDEALLDEAEAANHDQGLLRLWESRQTAVVVGCSSIVTEEVDVDACRARGVEILRRSSGGAAVVIGPGCLMYSVVLGYERYPQARMLSEAHRLVLSRLASALVPLVPGVEHCGTSDLAIEGRKVSGNSLRCRRTHFLYHGTLLYGMSLELMAGLLRTAPRQPGYRAGRDHAAFVRNVSCDPGHLRANLREAWQAYEPVTNIPHVAVARLVAEKYSRAEWNQRR